MTNDGSGPPRSFTLTTLPWLVGAGALVTYLLTLNSWVSLLSLGTVARVSGWSWQSEITYPLTLALLWPFRWLPQAWIPLFLNLFTAICAALVLTLLARCSALLPHDLSPAKPISKERPLSLLTSPSAWMPVALAALLLGLQLSFWEHATSVTGEMIDLLLFAYIIRCLLEFRVDQHQQWLSRSALLYAIGMANNWAMIGYFPVYLAAILRLKGLGPFLNLRFLLRMTLWGFLGLSLYLLLPTLHLFSSQDQWGFWPTLKTHLSLQKDAVSALRGRGFRILALVSLLPLLVLSIRWKSHTIQLGDDSRLGVFLTKATVHFLHGLFLAATLWIAFDPAFGPRHLRLGAPALTFYFGAALVFGYCTAYFLLIGSGGGPRWVGKAARVGIAILLGALPLSLGWKNLPQIRATNGRAMREFANQLYTDLPAGKSVALSDEPVQLLLLRAELARHRGEKDVLLVDDAALPFAQYHRVMAKQSGSRWPLAAPTNGLDLVPPSQRLKLVAGLASREPVFYLHPGFGPVFEVFNDQPRGLLHQLVPITTNDQPSDAAAATANEETWQKRWNGSLRSLAKQTSAQWGTAARPSRSFLARLGSAPEKSGATAFLAAEYSRSLDSWGVALQRLDRWPEAAAWFRRALELNPENQVARINSDYNDRYQRGDKTRMNANEAQAEVRNLLARHNNFREALRFNGPVDEPAFVLRTGRVLLASGNNHQAAREFARATDLAPDWVAPRLWLAQAFIKLRYFDRALEQVDSALALPEPAVSEGLAQMLLCRASALAGLDRTNEAIAFIESFAGKHGDQEEVLKTAADFYEQARQFEKQLAILDELVQRKPGQPEFLVKKGEAELQLARHEAAIATLTKVLALAPGNDEARLYRAVANLSSGRLDAARKDYEQLLHKSDHLQNALFGLGAIAWRQRDTNAAIQFYQRYLSNGVQASAQFTVAAERLKQLKNDQK